MNKTLEKAKIKVAETLKHVELEQFTIDYIMNVVDIAYDIGFKSQPDIQPGNSAQPVLVLDAISKLLNILDRHTVELGWCEPPRTLADLVIARDGPEELDAIRALINGGKS